MASDPLIGQSLDRYKIVALLGEGGMGAVYKAFDLTLQRDLAVKIMHAHFARQEDFQERFLQEARTAARLDHPGIVKVFDFGQARSLLYILMEFIPGDNLRKLVKDLRAANKGIVLDEALRLVRQVSLALDYIHHQGVLHRDIKPDNIMLKAEPSEGLPYRPVLTDLGLAKLAEGGMLTQDGVSMGTPAYMSPEQALGEKTDARSDVYSLGILLYELVVGQLPFPAKSLSEAIRYHTQTPPPPPHTLRADIPEPVEKIILKALEKDPADRYQDAASMAKALDEVLPEATQAAARSTELEAAASLHTQLQQSLVQARGTSILQEFPEAPADLSQDTIQILDANHQTRTVSMKPEGLTIGRDATNDIVIDSTKVSRQHARVEFDGNDYRVVDLDSTNGTYLGNIKLLPGMPQVWTADKALHIGEAWLRLVRTERSGKTTATGRGGTRLGTSLAQSSSGSERVGLFIDEPQISVAPGNSATIPMVILNQGSLVDHFKVSVSGIPENWITTPPPVIQLFPGTQKDVEVTLQPPVSPKSRAGHYPLAIRASSQDAPDQFAESRLTLTVQAYSKFTSEMRPQKIQSGQKGQISVHNDGNTPESYTILWEDRADELKFEPPQARLNVPEGETATASFMAVPRKRAWIGGAKSNPFVANVTSPAGEVHSHDGEAVSRALLPVWILPVLLLTCLCASAAAFAGIMIRNGQIASATQTQSADQTAIALAVSRQLNPTSTPVIIMITPTPEPTTQAPTLPPTGTPIPTATSTSTPSNTPTPTSAPTPFGGGGEIVFVSTRDGNEEIYKMNHDGSGLTRLTNQPADDWKPSWSPDGKQIAFVSDRDGNDEIYKMNNDGSGQTRLTNQPAHDVEPSWSPDGRQIVFVSNRDGNFEIYVMNADGSHQTRLTSTTSDERNPFWSPNGKRIAYVYNGDIYVMNADGSGQTHLTTNGKNDLPSWSPDGTKIAFVSYLTTGQHIYVMNSDGSNQTQLTTGHAAESDPIWSPDGQWIIYDSGTLFSNFSDLYIMDENGNNISQLTNGGANYDPDWKK